jgi:hypothetical protein
MEGAQDQAMHKICDLNNHVATFKYSSWGVCGAMVCRWMQQVRAGVAMQDDTWVGATGALILGQHLAMGDDEEASRRRVFGHFGLQLRNQFEFKAAGAGVRFSPNRVAQAATTPTLSYLSIRWLDADDDGQSHALGTWATNNAWYLCDPNFCLLRFDTALEFTNALTSLFSGNGIAPHIEDGAYPVLSATVYYMN